MHVVTNTPPLPVCLYVVTNTPLLPVSQAVYVVTNMLSYVTIYYGSMCACVYNSTLLQCACVNDTPPTPCVPGGHGTLHAKAVSMPIVDVSVCNKVYATQLGDNRLCSGYNLQGKGICRVGTNTSIYRPA